MAPRSGWCPSARRHGSTVQTTPMLTREAVQTKEGAFGESSGASSEAARMPTCEVAMRQIRAGGAASNAALELLEGVGAGG